MAAQAAPDILNGSPLPPEPALEDMEFVGCDAVPMSRETHALYRYKGKVEFYDIASETAWVIRDGSREHEFPIFRLADMISMIGAASGAGARSTGGPALVRAERRRRRGYAPHPDLLIFLDPSLRLGGDDQDYGHSHGHDVGDPARRPSVILEVDHTTDIRRGKLGVYEAWGLPELWVDVPDAPSRSRPAGMAPGLTIRVFEDGAYRRSEVSRAFPGWRAEDIHQGMNEYPASKRTNAELERLARLFGERAGTGPDDHPLMRSLRDESRREERLDERSGMVRLVLGSRGIAVSPDFPVDAAELVQASQAALFDAAMSCASESDFLARLRGR